MKVTEKEEEFIRTTSIPIADLVKIAQHGRGPSFFNPAPNCQEMNELGATFLNTDDPEERAGIERTFIETLWNTTVDDITKCIALAYLKNTGAITSKKAKAYVCLFEADPRNENIVARVNEHLGK